MKPRLVALILIGIVVFGAVEYRLSQPDERQPRSLVEEPSRSMAPSFAGYDGEMHLFRLKSYIGRQAMFVVFCGENKDVLANPNVMHLLAHQADVDAKGIRVVIVTSNLPQEIRSIELPKSFDVVSDFEQTKSAELFKAHRSFRCFDDASKTPLAKIFYIDRAGNVAFANGGPVGLRDPRQDVARLLGVTSLEN